jgi:predicted ATPase
MVQDGRLKADDHQMNVVTQLEKLQYQLQHYQPRPTNQSSILGKIFKRSPPTNKIKGAYIYGSVGEHQLLVRG